MRPLRSLAAALDGSYDGGKRPALAQAASPQQAREGGLFVREGAMNAVRVAVVQAAPVVFDVGRTLAKLHDLSADAARRGARLAVFPEAFVSAYPKGLGFGARMGTRSPEGREEFRRYFDSAVD